VEKKIIVRLVVVDFDLVREKYSWLMDEKPDKHDKYTGERKHNDNRLTLATHL
jgi:hypothetical protein